VVGRGELTDKAWARIEPLLPPVESGHVDEIVLSLYAAFELVQHGCGVSLVEDQEGARLGASAAAMAHCVRSHRALASAG
jgi:hypothetical protein